MSTRRHFLRTVPAATAALSTACKQDVQADTPQGNTAARPVVISTWRHGLAANAAAWELLANGGTALDAVEQAARVTEADPEVRTVGLGAYPDRDGTVTLDACIMGPDGDCGSVAYLQDILHPTTLARMVMERTPHVMLAGQGAKDFALAQGMTETNLLTESARRDYQTWLTSEQAQRPVINVENHDTIGILAIDQTGKLAGACTTSGASYKYAGRIGDSPIIGAGLYVDNAIGAATATGWGEAVIRACGSFLVVELMRQGHHPQRACELAVERVIERNPDWAQIQVGFVALDKLGRTGSYCIAPGFEFARHIAGHEPELKASSSRL